MLADDLKTESFTEFFELNERRLRLALSAGFGSQLGREAAAEALAYGWENWERVVSMENPAGYLFRVGQDRARRDRRRRPVFGPVNPGGEVWVEPGLPGALAGLPFRQRLVVGLVHGVGWHLSEVAELLGVSKGTVQTHAERGLKKLRRELGVEA